MNDIMFGEEDVKYIKRKKRNKKAKKASHKHKYDSYIMLQCKRKSTLKVNSLDYALVNYCSECGRIKDLKYFLDEETISKFKKRKKVMIVDSINDYVKYIPIVRKNDN